MARELTARFGGEVPADHDALESLPGVGRKTANVVMSCAFGADAIAVDTHVFRVANRLGLADAPDVLKTERQLMQNIPQSQWSRAHHWLIYHGRRVCAARKPACESCTLRAWCEYANGNPKGKNKRAEAAARRRIEKNSHFLSGGFLMLGKVCLKRLRFVLYAVLFFLLTLDITNRTGSGLIATVCIWLALPLAFVVLVWWIYACVRDTVRLLRDGVAPEDTPTWAEYAVWWVQDELAEIASLDERSKARYFLRRVGGVLLGALGLVLIVRDSVVLGTLLLIAG